MIKFSKPLVAEAILFAVYGTLKKGHRNHHYLDHDTVQFMGVMQTEPKYTMVSCHGAFPAVHCEGDTSIHLELYRTRDSEVIESVYHLEGYSGTPGPHNEFYDVEQIDTPFGKASMFVFRRPVTLPVVKSGCWDK